MEPQTSDDISQADEPLFLTEKEWNKLIRDIHHGQVIPVVGPELITLPDVPGEPPVTLRRKLAPLLARSERINLSGEIPDTVNEVVADYLLAGGKRTDVYDEIRELLDELKAEPPSDVLRRLARVAGFDFWIASTFDHQLSKALEAERVDYTPAQHLLRYHPTAPVDIPEPVDKTCLYHILGDYDTYPDFAVWEEDYMEFICGSLKTATPWRNYFGFSKNAICSSLVPRPLTGLCAFFCGQRGRSDFRTGVREARESISRIRLKTSKHHSSSILTR